MLTVRWLSHGPLH